MPTSWTNQTNSPPSSYSAVTAPASTFTPQANSPKASYTNESVTPQTYDVATGVTQLYDSATRLYDSADDTYDGVTSVAGIPPTTWTNT